jgi:hypothetical protein
MRRLKSWRSIVLIIFLIGAVFGGWYFTSQSIKVTYPQAWADWRDKLQDAATEYRNANNGSLPIVGSGAVIVDGEQQHIIDICQLKESKLVPYPPENCISLSGADDDNCDSGDTGNCSCHEKAHYIWTVDMDGNVHSACIGEDCESADADGYQGVWP